MVDDTNDRDQHFLPDREKRAFTRNAIFLVGECVISNQPMRSIEILDFCPGGVYLSFAPGQQVPQSSAPARGEIIEIRCTIPAKNGAQSLHFQGKIARADYAGAGVAFINPSFEALHALHEFAKTSPAESKRHVKKVFKGEGASDEPLISVCRQIVEDAIAPMAKTFLEQVTERFFNVAGEVRNIAEKNAYYSALNIFNKDGQTFYDEFLARMGNRLRQPPPADRVTEKSTQAPSGSALSLIEEEAFEDWLAFTDMARAAELENRETLHELERRLSVLFKRTVDKENNPFGPGAISQSFQEALGTLALDRKTAAESCKVFKNVLCEQTGELYTALNQCLVDGGVLPVLPHSGKPVGSVQKAPAKPASQPEKPSFAQSGSAPDNGLTRIEGAPLLPTEASPSVGGPNTFQGQAAAVPVISDLATSSGTSAPPAEYNPSTSMIVTSQQATDWYQLIQGLGNLQQQLSVQPIPAAGSMQTPPQALFSEGATIDLDASPGQVGSPVASPVEIRHFTTDELLSALSSIRLESPGKQKGETFHQDFMLKLRSALAASAPNANAWEVPNREINILEIGGNLFDSLLSDKLVAHTVKPWLNQLSIPLIKMALRDDSLFYDKSHLARQLINKVAELELFSEVSKVENSVRRKIDGLLTSIADADEVTPELLNQMLKEVSMLVRVQNRAYEGNIRELRELCKFDQERSKSKKPSGKLLPLNKLVGANRHQSGDELPPEMDDSMRECLRRVQRLKIGSWLLFERNGVQKRIRLAWIAENRDKYVFANVQGLREETFSQVELAQYLRDGAATVLDDGDEQLIDRAQSAMLQKMHLQLIHETSHDQLTGLINRREFEKCLENTLAKVRDSGTPSMLCYVDLEQFSVVNSTFGYEGGDRALVEVAGLLGNELGDLGTLARIGGTEFAMLFENSNLAEALQVTSRQTEAFRVYRFVSSDKSLSLSFSAGLVAIDPESENIETLLQAAEASCRIARSKGSNYVQVYDVAEADTARHLNTVKWVSRIDDALDNDRLELHCQPIISISGSDRVIHHSEVLLRVLDTQGKLTSPVDFIMAAEHFRRMASVDRWVLEHSFRWIVDRRDRLSELGGLAINLSGASLNEEGLIDFVIDRADKLNVPMSSVCFEVTETVGIARLSGASEFINELKNQTGCTFSLDDFGSGQSSYAYLKNLPVDYLKIDGAFVEKMDQNPYDFAVVKSITEIGHFMGKKIIAERVETESVVEMLHQLGVDYAQGYYFGKPSNINSLGQ